MTLRLLCPDGCGVQPVKEHSDAFVLECGHTRNSFMPSKAGALSVEALSAARSREDRKRLAELFPVCIDSELTSLRQCWA